MSAMPADTIRNTVAPAAANNICTYLDWDSGFFGKRVGRLNRSRLTASDACEASDWCTGNRIDCLYFLADADDAETCHLAEQNNFIEVDVRLTLARPVFREDHVERPAMDSRIRLARKSDLVELRRCARTLHRDTRFYFDQKFERAKCDLLYQTWIGNSFLDPSQTVFVPEVDGQPVGYLACHARDREAQIGLLGVSEAHTGAGLGKALVRRFLSWSAEQQALRATVVTQARNTAARGLYEYCGFLPSSSQRWYHRWFTSK
jgi:RimJ/RimL family protein N-acetyltransferase